MKKMVLVVLLISNVCYAKEIRLLHISDPQYGWFADQTFKIERAAMNRVKEIIKEKSIDALIISGDLVDALPGQRGRAKQIEAMKATLKLFTIPVIIAPGNHDVGTMPTTKSINRWVSDLGIKHFGSYKVRGLKIATLNSSVIKYPNYLKLFFNLQMNFIKEEKAINVLIMHHPIYVKSITEGWQYWNLPIHERKIIIKLFEEKGVSLILNGHTHIPAIYNINRMLTCNAGSVSGPRGNTKQNANFITIKNGIINCHNFSIY